MTKLYSHEDLFTIRHSLVKKRPKNCSERPHLGSGRFMKVFHKKITCPKWTFLSGPKSGHLIHVWLYLYSVTLSARDTLMHNTVVPSYIWNLLMTTIIHPTRHNYSVLEQLNTTIFQTSNIALKNEITSMNNGRKQTIIFLEVPENSRKIQVNLTSNTVFVRIFKIHKKSRTILVIHGNQVPVTTLLIAKGQTGNKYFIKWWAHWIKKLIGSVNSIFIFPLWIFKISTGVNEITSGFQGFLQR